VYRCLLNTYAVLNFRQIHVAFRRQLYSHSTKEMNIPCCKPQHPALFNWRHIRQVTTHSTPSSKVLSNLRSLGQHKTTLLPPDGFDKATWNAHHWHQPCPQIRQAHLAGNMPWMILLTERANWVRPWQPALAMSRGSNTSGDITSPCVHINDIITTHTLQREFSLLEFYVHVKCSSVRTIKAAEVDQPQASRGTCTLDVNTRS